MPVQTSYEGAIPVEVTESNSKDPQHLSQLDIKARDYVMAWRNKLREYRLEKLTVWNECWALYRGQEDFSNKEDWQSKIVLPKSWGTVKAASNVIKRLLKAAEHPFKVETTNPNDQLGQLRGEKMTDLSRVFLDKAKFIEEFSVGLETGFIMGCGIWKVGWWLVPRTRMRVETPMNPLLGNPALQQPYAYPPQQQVSPGGIDGGRNPQGSPTTTPQPAAPTPPPTGQEAVGRANPYVGGPNQAQGPEPLAEQTMPPRGAALPLGQGRMELLQQQNSQYPTQLGQEALLPPGALNTPGSQPTGQPNPQDFLGLNTPAPQKSIVREEVLEGRLFIQAVDPYNFYWLTGSKLNRWTGTIEEMEVPKWQLIEMAEHGAFDMDVINAIGPMLIPEQQRQTYLRFGEMPRGAAGPTNDTGVVKITEYYGPLVIDGKTVEKYAHIIIANDMWVLKNGKNVNWHRKPPYCAFSPLVLPFRTEGTGLVEMTRQIDRALNQIVNLGVDTLMFRLLPIFEFTPDIYENPEDFKTGLTPGKMFRRNQNAPPNDLGIKPIQFSDVGPGAAQMLGVLDRAHQEGGLVTEIQQSLPRWSGSQTATETEAIQQNQSSFFGSLAADIEMYALSPLIEMAVDTIMQYIDTSNDPRVAAILGVDQGVLAGMSHPEILEMIQGDYEIQVRGLSSNLEKADMLQNLIQLMNLIGQNPEAWLPYMQQDELLRRILEAFRPSIHDIEKIIADPQTVAANKQAQDQQKQMMEFTKMIPQLANMAHETQKTQMQGQQHENDMHSKIVDQAITREGQQNEHTRALRQMAIDAAKPKEKKK